MSRKLGELLDVVQEPRLSLAHPGSLEVLQLIVDFFGLGHFLIVTEQEHSHHPLISGFFKLGDTN